MIPAKGTIGRMLDRPDAEIRFYLFFGQDDSQSRVYAARLLKGLDAEKVAISAAAIKSDPAVLADEAAAIGLFGGKRLLWIDPAGEDIVAGVEALLQAAAPESAVVAIAGDLKKSSALRKLAEANKAALAQISYMPEARDLDRIIDELARSEGLVLQPGMATKIAALCGNDRAVLAQELSKFATYLDASPAAPRQLDSNALEAVGAGLAESGFNALADLALGGDLEGLSEAFETGAFGDGEVVSLVRSVQRRLLMVAPIRARIDSGEAPGAVMASMGKALFWKDKEVVGRIVAKWDSPGLARVAARLGKLERELMLGDAPRVEAIAEELTAIARAARRR